MQLQEHITSKLNTYSIHDLNKYLEVKIVVFKSMYHVEYRKEIGIFKLINLKEFGHLEL